MATEKVSLTLDNKVLKEARARVGRRGLSSYVDKALRLRLQQDRLRALLDELDTEHGPVPQNVTAKVQSEWLLERKPRKRSPRRG